MSEPLLVLIENSIQIAWDYLEGTGEIADPTEASEFLLKTIEAMFSSGERRQLLLSNRAIAAYRQHKQELAA